jgi:hypothetical protein
MPIRVLALCGFTQNAHIYSKQVRIVSKVPKTVADKSVGRNKEVL